MKVAMTNEKPQVTDAQAIAEAIREGMIDTSSISDFCRERYRLTIKPSDIARIKAKLDQRQDQPGGAFSESELCIAGWALKAFTSVERAVAALQEAERIRRAWNAELPPEL